MITRTVLMASDEMRFSQQSEAERPMIHGPQSTS